MIAQIVIPIIDMIIPLLIYVLENGSLLSKNLTAIYKHTIETINPNTDTVISCNSFISLLID